MIISNAKDILLTANPGTLPNVSGAMLDYFQSMTFSVVTKTVTDHEVVETLATVTALGVRQPFTARQLMIKPEGQRSWKWETIHALPGLVLNTDDIITFGGAPYRVMQMLDYKEYGYVEYHICQGYT